MVAGIRDPRRVAQRPAEQWVGGDRGGRELSRDLQTLPAGVDLVLDHLALRIRDEVRRRLERSAAGCDRLGPWRIRVVPAAVGAAVFVSACKLRKNKVVSGKAGAPSKHGRSRDHGGPPIQTLDREYTQLGRPA